MHTQQTPASPAPHGVSLKPRTDTAVDALVRQIRALIRDEKLSLGDHLPTERELGARFAAGRNTVREALRTLKAYGLIDVRPKVGAVLIDRAMEAALDLFQFQMEVSRDTFRDVQSFRRLVEVGIVEQKLLECSAADLDCLDQINSRMREAATVSESAELDFAFHQALVQLASNRTLSDIYRFLKPVIISLMRLGKSRRPNIAETHAAHAGIVEALRAQDHVAFADRMGRHLESGLRFVSVTQPPDAEPGLAD